MRTIIKTIITFLFAALCVFFITNNFGCGHSNVEYSPEYSLRNYKIVVIDSCEYIMYSSYNSYTFEVTHKGNCKYCQERLINNLKNKNK